MIEARGDFMEAKSEDLMAQRTGQGHSVFPQNNVETQES